jgi:hypothetical protein
VNLRASSASRRSGASFELRHGGMPPGGEVLAVISAHLRYLDDTLDELHQRHSELTQVFEIATATVRRAGEMQFCRIIDRGPECGEEGVLELVNGDVDAHDVAEPLEERGRDCLGHDVPHIGEAATELAREGRGDDRDPASGPDAISSKQNRIGRPVRPGGSRAPASTNQP